MEAINETRLGVWKRQPKRFFAEAVIDADGNNGAVVCRLLQEISGIGEEMAPEVLVQMTPMNEPAAEEVAGEIEEPEIEDEDAFMDEFEEEREEDPTIFEENDNTREQDEALLNTEEE